MTRGERAWVKFFGSAANRASPDLAVLDVLERTGAHRAGSYPAGRRPRSVRDGDRMFLARLVVSGGVADILVFGRATALAYVEGRDDASEADTAERPWQRRWPHYVRFHDGELVAGTLADGVSLGELMDALGAEAFATTQRNALSAAATSTRARPTASSRRCGSPTRGAMARRAAGRGVRARRAADGSRAGRLGRQAGR